jgi:choice-of-anchor A domain-containing protein
MSNRDSVQSKRLRGAGVLAWILLAASAGQAASVGPDAFGYVASEATVYSFVDIASSGIGVLTGADDDQAIVNIGFAFQFYGQTYTSLCASTNGLISFGGCNMAFANQDLTASSPPGNLPTVAPFWSDLTFAVRGSGAIHYQTLGSAPNRQFVVQWTNAFPINAPEGVTFQAIFFESSNRILFQYKNVNAGAGSPVSLGGRTTVGIRDVNGHANGRRLQWSYNVPVLKNGMALEFAAVGGTPVDLGAAGPRHWAVLSLGRPTALSLAGGAVVTGKVADVGGAASSTVSVSGQARIDGKVWIGASAKLDQSGKGVIAGGVVTGAAAQAKLQQAVSDALAASAMAASLGATIPGITSINLTSPSQVLTIPGGSGRNVVNLTNLVITSGALTLQAPAGGTFVINVSGEFSVNGPGTIQVAGGLLPLAVLFNITGAGAEVTVSGGPAGPTAKVHGIILAPSRSITIAPRPIMGEVIGGGAKLTIEGQTTLLNNPF